MPPLGKLLLLAAALGFAPSKQTSITDADLSAAMAWIIQKNGLPCAKVLDMRPLDQSEQYEVICTERSGQEATVRYVMNMRDGTAIKA